MTRRMLDCREVPSDSGCSLTLTGSEDEVLEAGAAHAVAVHGHTDGPELRDALRGALRDAPQATGPGAFVQLIEFRTQHYDQMDGLIDGWASEIGADRTAQWMIMGRDRDHADTYVEVVEFPSAEAAQANSDSPVTTAFAGKMTALCDGPVGFRNLDVIRAMTP
ncbi:DUF1059 domain-containing protein [Actinomycetospora straminea]|uniref:DUF1059 domain-containing protein n=1 Tax=Actinomycetospora straminea TaxID=663607 RepID=A0ABP9F3C4_9PSEU|nr:DUF1059 domain-containing protein [Actinomycetospora straminea]MDD7931763.1 DUF1059 domain-containing protein [Actinomycetospora straminea]